VKIAITDHNDSSGKNTSANNGTYPTRNAQENAEKITTKSKNEPSTLILRRYCDVLTDRIARELPAFRGKPRFCKKDTVNRRKEIERLFAMMRFANVREQSNGE
jgi:hypothetical protein